MTMLGRDNHQLLLSGSGGGGGVADLPTTELDLTTEVQDLFGGTVDLGTDGFATMRWRRNGRFVEGNYYMAFDTDATYPSGGPFYVASSDLPYAPRTSPAGLGPFAGFLAQAGHFGFFTNAPSTEMHPLGIGFANLGGGNVDMVFPRADQNTGGLNTLWSPTNPFAMSGEYVNFQGFFRYEAASAA